MKKPVNFDAVVGQCMVAADNASIIASGRAGSTSAQVTRETVTAAFTAAVLNGMISINEPVLWKHWMSIETRFQ